MMIERPAAMALLLALLLVLLLATGGQADADEPATSQQRAAPPEQAPAPAPEAKGYETLREEPAPTGSHRHREIKIGACFPISDGGSSAFSCYQRCTSKGYAGGRCDTLPSGFPGDCFCITYA